jgi:hypothetical protein
MKLRTRIAALFLAVAAITAVGAPGVASAETVSPSGLNVCKTTYVTVTEPWCFSFSGLWSDCHYIKKVVTCTRY